MSLQQAFDNSGTNSQKPYDNELIYQNLTKEKEEEKPAVKSKKKNEPEEDDEDESSIKEEREYNRQLSSGTDGDLTDIIGLGGKILILHDELLHKVFSYLPVDSYGSLALVSPHWKHFTRTEAVYRRLCERLYLQQSKRKQLHLSRFGGKYRTMLEQRPRVRAAGGCYVLKYSYIKKIQRDMWTEVRRNWITGESLGHWSSSTGSSPFRGRSPKARFWKLYTTVTSISKKTGEYFMLFPLHLLTRCFPDY